MGLKRVEKVLEYLNCLNKKQRIEQMNRADMEQLLKSLGWSEERDYEQARYKLLKLVNYLAT